jgi:hypothetical protein
MTADFTVGTRLCPNCANSISADAAKCPYCKTEVSPDSTPQWLKRNDSAGEPRVGPNRASKFPLSSKFVWPAAMLAVALTAFFLGSYIQRRQQFLTAQAYAKQLQTKEQMIQTQETQLAETRKRLDENTNQMTEMKMKLEGSQKELAASQQHLTEARAAQRSAGERSASARRTAAPVSSAAAPSSPAPRQTANSGVYETTQATSVYENPSSTARVISQIGRGTRINVVNSSGAWLEVHSRHGNPPGYVRADDARPITRAN